MHYYMNRLGFVNFWDFKNEEIYFNKGNALIRGENGSGKSIVLQSAIVYLLDGSMRPERLDPSGTNSRQMSYYLLGNDEMITDATGYLYLEFYHPGKRSYITIATGLHAKRNGGVDFWGFSLEDGRRIGKDVRLYKEEGAALLPISKKECKALIRKDGQNFFTEKQQEYERSVNQLLFGLTDKKYKELLNFLMEIRKPIAGADSKKGLKFIYDKLNTSLPIMKGEDLAALTISLQSMDALENTLNDLRSKKSILKKINKVYDTYADTLLAYKYRDYQKVLGDYNRIQNDLKKDLKEARLRRDNLADLKLKEKQLLQGQEEVSAKLFNLKNKENFEEVKRIHSQMEESQKKEEKLKKQISESEEDLISLGYKIKENDNQKYIHQKDIKDSWEILDEYAWELDLPFHQEHKDETSYDQIKGMEEQILLFKAHLEESLKLLEEKEAFEVKLDQEKSKAILTQNKIEDYKKRLARREEEFEEGKRYLIKELQSYGSACQILNLEGHLNGLSKLVKENKFKEVDKALLNIFLEGNNHYQERNGYIKAKYEITSEEILQKELSQNLLKLNTLLREYSEIPGREKLESIKNDIVKLGFYIEKENEFLDRQEEGQAAMEQSYGTAIKSLRETTSKYGFLYPLKSEKYIKLLKLSNEYLEGIHHIEKEIGNYEMCVVMEHTYGSREEEINDILLDFRYQKEEVNRNISQYQYRLEGLESDVDQSQLLELTKKSEDYRNQIAATKAQIDLLESIRIPEIEENIKRETYAKEGKKREVDIVFEQLEKECRWKGISWSSENLEETIAPASMNIEEATEELINTYRDYENVLIPYGPRLERKIIIEDYSRYFLTFKNLLPKDLEEQIKREIKDKEDLLDEQETSLYQKVLLDTASQKMIYKIRQSKEWVDKISERMRKLKTTSGLIFNLRWLPKKAETQSEIGTELLEEIINKKAEGTIETEDLELIKDHFSSKLKQERIYAADQDLELDYETIIKNCFDYRNWYEFKMYLTEPGYKEKELTNKRFMSLSGGERATAIYSSLLSALNSLYSECEVEDHPRFMGLDEAFTVCDSSNTEAVFEFIAQMDLEYLLNSQTLWGTYPSVRNLAISHLTHDEKSKSVAITRFRWDGKKRSVQFTES